MDCELKESVKFGIKIDGFDMERLWTLFIEFTIFDHSPDQWFAHLSDELSYALQSGHYLWVHLQSTHDSALPENSDLNAKLVIHY